MPASCTTSLLYVNLSKNSFFNAHEYLILESECKGKELINTNQIFWERCWKNINSFLISLQNKGCEGLFMGVIPTFNDTHVSSVVISLSDFDNY